MTQVVDTNVLARCGPDALAYVKSSTAHVLAMGGALTARGKEELTRMDAEYIKRNISPGGCADLLSVTILLDQLEKLNQ
jgi:triphosphoribosyl-dephospho-CoA synthase